MEYFLSFGTFRRQNQQNVEMNLFAYLMVEQASKQVLEQVQSLFLSSKVIVNPDFPIEHIRRFVVAHGQLVELYRDAVGRCINGNHLGRTTPIRNLTVQEHIVVAIVQKAESTKLSAGKMMNRRKNSGNVWKLSE